MLVFTATKFCAAILSTLPRIWFGALASKIDPAPALRVTLAEPARTLPLPARLPLLRVIEMSPLLVATFVPISVSALASLTVSVEPLPVMLAISVPTLVLRAVEFWAVTLRTLPLTWPTAWLRVMPPRLALRVTLAEPAMMLPLPFSVNAGRKVQRGAG